MPLVAIEGIDKSGKKTQTRILAERLVSLGLQVCSIAFPDYKTPLGSLIRRFLEGNVEFRPEVRQLLYVANRWEREPDMSSWLREGRFVIADRYIPAGLVYGLANGLDLDWMRKLEENLPEPDLVIVIDVSSEVAASRSRVKDVYEKNLAFQSKVRGCYLNLGKSLGWRVVNGEQPMGKVAEDVWSCVKPMV